MPKPRANNDPNAHTCEKTCSKCQETKYLIDFPFKSAIKQTYRGECRVCRNKILQNDNKRRKLIKEREIIRGFREAIIRSSLQQASSQQSS